MLRLLLSVLQVGGAQIVKMLERSLFQSIKLRYLASARSAEESCNFRADVTIEETTEDAEGVDVLCYSAGGSTSAKYTYILTKQAQ